MGSVRIKHCLSLPATHLSAVYQLLDACEGEFVPPLSQRRSTHQADLAPSEAPASGVDAYFDEMRTQAFLLALDEENTLLSFLSYIPSYELPRGILPIPSAYVSTICTARMARKAGLARRLYEELERVVPDKPLSLRTWSTNTAQIRLMHGLGWREALRLVDDRGRGIDTIYFVKER